MPGVMFWNRNLLSSLFVALTAVAASAEDGPKPIEPEAVTLGRPVDYAQDIAPVLEANCVACHNIAIDEGDLSLEDVPAMLKGGGRGPAIVPAKPDESLLLAVASHRRDPLMPPPENDVEAKPLTPRELGLIRQWILEGAGQGQAPAGSVIAWRSLPGDLNAISSVDLSAQSRFIAAARGNQVEIYDLPRLSSAGRLIDPNLSGIGEGNAPLYPHGAADRDVVHAVAFNPAGTLLATAGFRTVKLWRRAGLGEVKPLELSGIETLASTADGTLISVAGGTDVRLVSTSDGREVARWSTMSKAIAVAVSDDHSMVAAAGDDKSIRVWRVGGEPLPPRSAPAPVTDLAFVGDRIVSGHDDGVVRVWPITGDQFEQELKGHDGPVRSIAHGVDRVKTIVTTGADGTTRVWDVSNGKEVRSISHGAALASVAISPDGKTLVAGSTDGVIRFWKLEDGSKTAETKAGISQQRAYAEATETVEWRTQLAGVADSQLKASEAALKDREEIQKKAVEAREAAAKALEAAKTADQEAAAAMKTAVDQSVGKPDDTPLKTAAEAATKKSEEARKNVAASEEALRSAERAIGLAEAAVQTIREQLEARKQVKQSADEAVTAATAAAEQAKTAAEQPVTVSAVAFSRNGDRVVVAVGDQTFQTFSTSGRPLDSISAFPTKTLVTTADGAVVALREDATVQRIDVTGRWEYAAVLGPPPETPLDLGRSKFADRVLSLAFSPDGRLLATGGGEPSRTGELMLWDVETRTPVRTFADAHSDTVQSVAISRDGQVLASAAADKFAKTFDLASGSLIRTFEGHTDHVLGVALKADNTAIATAAADLSVKVWDSETGEQQRTISGYGKQVTALRFVGLKSEIVSASGDKTVRLHESADGKQVRAFAGATDYVHSVAVSDDGATVVAGGDDGVLFVWDGKTGKLLHRFEPPRSADTATAAK